MKILQRENVEGENFVYLHVGAMNRNIHVAINDDHYYKFDDDELINLFKNIYNDYALVDVTKKEHEHFLTCEIKSASDLGDKKIMYEITFDIDNDIMIDNLEIITESEFQKHVEESKKQQK